MTLHTIHAPAPRSRTDAQALPPATRPRHASTRPARDFGVGYGNSSGYASDRRYVRDWGSDRFRIG